MRNNERRAEERIPLTQRASLGIPNSWHPCLIEDFSSSGFLVMCAMQCRVGDILDLESELYPERFLQCKVCVRHINGDCLGINIVEMSNAGLALCNQFIGEHVSLTRFR